MIRTSGHRRAASKAVRGLVALAAGLLCSAAAHRAARAYAQDPAIEGNKQMSVYDFTLPDINGKDVSLSSYKGKVLLLVNVASKCGNTPQYEGLEQLYRKYKDQGLVILGFPANNFGSQEPGTNAEIKEFCTSKYNVDFPMFSKISVLGDDQHPLYQFLTSKETDPDYSGAIRWNFAKFLIGRGGAVVARFDPKAQPDSKELVQAVEQALGASAGTPDGTRMEKGLRKSGEKTSSERTTTSTSSGS
jgi:glutathione peroxidase